MPVPDLLGRGGRLVGAVRAGAGRQAAGVRVAEAGAGHLRDPVAHPHGHVARPQAADCLEHGRRLHVWVATFDARRIAQSTDGDRTPKESGKALPDVGAAGI